MALGQRAAEASPYPTEAPAGGTSGSGGSTITEDCARTEATSTDTTTIQPADIIFAIDSSGSMDEEIEFVQTYMNQFSQQIVASGIDVRVILIGDEDAICIGAPLGSGQCPNDTNLPQYVHVAEEVGSNDGLNVVIDTFPQWRQYLRPNATKFFVIVTDDDATDGPNNSSAAFAASVAALDPTLFASWTFNGIYCFTDCPDAAEVGEVYIDLVADTGGVGGDLCLQDFQPVFDRLAQQIITGSSSQIACEWEFPDPPAGQTFSANLVEVRRTSSTGGSTTLVKVVSASECGSEGGWYFDDAVSPTKIIACPATCTAIQGDVGGKIDVIFGCEMVGGCAASSSEATSTRLGADIIFALDSSRSMDAEVGFVQQNMNAFSQQIVASGVDARVIVIADPSAFCIAAPLGSGQCPNDSQPPAYIHIPEEVGSNDVLNVYIDTYPQWSQYLRPNTQKMFVVVTDDDASDDPINSAAEFRAALQQLNPSVGNWAYSGIFCFTECPEAAAVGTIHRELVQSTGGGVSGDLCLQDFAPVFDRLAEAIITGSQIACEWPIPSPPAGETLDLGNVNVRYTNAAGVGTTLGNVPSAADCANHDGGWYYDDPSNPTTILVCPQTCTQMQAASGETRVDVLFGCKTEVAPPR
jgi:hypothetical protein